jgi:sterol 14-demethylase
MGFLTDLYADNQTTLLLTGLVLIFALIYSFRTSIENQPPMVKYSIPFLGSAIPYGIDPVKFLQDCAAVYGDCFTFMMMGRRMTFCLNPEGNHFVFNIPLASASAEGMWAFM